MARKRVCIRNNRSDNDSEDELQESVILQISEGSSVHKTRGFTRMADVWNLPPHSLIVVTFNKVHQPVGVEGTVLKRFIGFMVRKPNLTPINYTDWLKMPIEYKTKMWEIIEKRSAIGKANRSKQTTAHAAGRKSYAQHVYEMELNDGAPPSRPKLYVKTHKRKDGRPVDEESARNIARLEELMSQCSDNSHGGSGGSIIWDKNDIYSQVVAGPLWAQGHRPKKKQEKLTSRIRSKPRVTRVQSKLPK
ncbi:hypothetical protein G2W53_040264 [Senna tora]|uniref:Uncharacterized protein n=1 Tax=Senna tora TaxID=362788 RepID=A0A834SP43_9FABA|nr:hypothetical protein G2W53_040264 [Senna tora]